MRADVATPAASLSGLVPQATCLYSSYRNFHLANTCRLSFSPFSRRKQVRKFYARGSLASAGAERREIWMWFLPARKPAGRRRPTRPARQVATVSRWRNVVVSGCTNWLVKADDTFALIYELTVHGLENWTRPIADIIPAKPDMHSRSPDVDSSAERDNRFIRQNAVLEKSSEFNILG